MRRCWIAAKADYRPCLSTGTQHRDHWMQPQGECAHRIFFQGPESTASPPAYSQCRALPPRATWDHQWPRATPPTVHRPQGVTVPLHWFAGCPSPLVPRCGFPGASGVWPAVAPAMRPGAAAPAPDIASHHRAPARAQAAPLPAGTSFLLLSAATSPRSRAIRPPLTPCPPGARVAALERTVPANAAVRGLARSSSTGAPSPFARGVSCPPCSRKF